MIQIDDRKIEYVYSGLFTTDKEWIHPRVCEKTHEIIYVTEGEVCLFEGEDRFRLKKGQLIILKPGVFHGGFQKSVGKTSFYWLHFKMEEELLKSMVTDGFDDASLFREILHFGSMPSCPGYVKDCVLAHILGGIFMASDTESVTALARNIFEWTRINARAGLEVRDVAEHFGYNSEHISRLIKKSYGISLKAVIDDFIIKKAGDYLLNTTYSIKEISGILGFSEANNFINFYKYHEKISPAKYRNSRSRIHMNNK